MKSYLDIVKHILDKGERKESRAGNTIAVPCVDWHHYPGEEGFPLLTVRKMPFRSICVELQGFIAGITSKKWYNDRGCKFWNYWANPKEVSRLYRQTVLGKEWFDISKFDPKNIDDLGPMGYGYQWRKFGQVYDEDDNGPLEGVDQLASLVDKLKNNPNDRRMVVSYWNPPQLDSMALPPCTIDFGVTVIGGKLHLSWHQRSCDFLIGGGADIAGMALLQRLLTIDTGLKLGKLSGRFIDCHIYENHLDKVDELLSREPRSLPNLDIMYPEGKANNFSIFEWEADDYQLFHYNPHPAIDFPISV